jgi:hypothetical protein
LTKRDNVRNVTRDKENLRNIKEKYNVKRGTVKDIDNMRKALQQVRESEKGR